MSKYEITVDGKKFVVEVGDVSTSPIEVVVNGERKTVTFKEAGEVSVAPAPSAPATAPEAAPEPSTPAPAPAPAPVGAAEGEIVRAPMPGKILSITVNVGDSISEGDTVCTLEAMKMEMPISSTVSGTVKAIHVRVGDNVAYDDPLITLG